jgi:hypothetical protein
VPNSTRHSATSRLRATRLVGVAVGAASHSDPVHAAHVASSKLTKVANDGEKKRRREEKAGVMGGDGVAATARAAGSVDGGNVSWGGGSEGDSGLRR